MRLFLRATVEPPKWQEILSRFPKQLQDEIKEERPEGDVDDRWEFANLYLEESQPVEVEITRQLIYAMEYAITPLPQDVFDAVCKKWNVTLKKDPKFGDRTLAIDYSKLPSDSARPGVMVDGKIWFGCHRFVAALIRGDKTYKAWKLKSRQ